VYRYFFPFSKLLADGQAVTSKGDKYQCYKSFFGVIYTTFYVFPMILTEVTLIVA
jgi:hypothetical protein